MQVYLERITHQQFNGTFIEFIPHYFDGIYFTESSGNFAFHGMHLWYLLVLFIITLIFMPLFWWFKSEKGSYILGRLGDILAVPGLLLLLLLPTILLHNIISNEGGLVVGGWQMPQYIWFFFAGYLIFSNQKLQLQIVKTRWISTILSVLIISISIYFDKGPSNHADILVWLELLAIIGFAMKHLNFSNKFLDYSREAVIPFYILHQNILLLLGYFIVKISAPDLIKFLLIFVGTFVTILVLYEYLIRRYNVIRVLFGMKRKKESNAKLSHK